MEYVTIHHIKDISSDLHYELRYGEQDHPTVEQFNQYYQPAETIRGTSNVEKAYHEAQGHVVNETQNARHMVHSSMPTDVYEVHDGNSVEYYMVKPIGFVKINWDNDNVQTY